MKRYGLIMEMCGVVMAVVSAWGPLMNPYAAVGMLIVAGLMILNGAIMQRREPVMAGRA